MPRTAIASERTAISTPRFAVRDFLNSIQLYGDGDDISVPSSATLNVGTGNFSYSLWLKPDRIGVGDWFLNKWLSGNNGFEALIQTTGQIRLTLRGTGPLTSVADGGYPALNRWNHVVVCRNDNVGTVYLNGALVATSGATINAGDDLDNEQNQFFGSRQGGDSDYSGNLTDIRFYKGLVMDLTQVENLYYHKQNPQAPTCHWDFSDESGSTLTDVVAAQNGTLNNGASHNPLWTTDSPFKPRTEAPQFQNLALRSEDFSNGSWVKTNATVTANDITAPDGTLTADKIKPTISATTTLYQVRNVIGGSPYYTYSIYVKKGSGATDCNRFALRNSTTATTLLTCIFNYDTGECTGGATAVDVGDGWWRISLTVSTGINSGNNITMYAGFTGVAETEGEYAYLWGAQFTQANWAGPYVQTVATAVNIGAIRSIVT